MSHKCPWQQSHKMVSSNKTQFFCTKGFHSIFKSFWVFFYSNTKTISIIEEFSGKFSTQYICFQTNSDITYHFLNCRHKSFNRTAKKGNQIPQHIKSETKESVSTHRPQGIIRQVRLSPDEKEMTRISTVFQICIHYDILWVEME